MTVRVERDAASATAERADGRERLGARRLQVATAETDALPVATVATTVAPAVAKPRKKPDGSVGWTPTDYLVALLAIGVLAISIVGLLWLVQSQ